MDRDVLRCHGFSSRWGTNAGDQAALPKERGRPKDGPYLVNAYAASFIGLSASRLHAAMALRISERFVCGR